ncbi:EAL domain-containing protein [Fulvimarina sp. MAC3]|uniref:bifunctional diguanylate cyclase/phosphodiesterase n=1 Tax=Fulvimarina sp. MAC3 TaxID=3148887 RepID=UPI0031FBAFA2
MMVVVGCIVELHNPWLVSLAAAICVFGSWAMVRLLLRAANSPLLERSAWIVLTAFVAGISIWSVHFIAMLGYEPGLPIGFDPVLTLVSLIVVVVGSGTGFLIAAARLPSAPAIGGVVVGLSTAVMHYTGMLAYRVPGIVSWDETYLLVSIILACALSALAMHVLLRGQRWKVHAHSAIFFFFLAIFGLHFTGMTAFQVEPLLVDGSYSNPQAIYALALAVASVGLMVIGGGFASSFIYTKVRATAADALANMSNGLTVLSANGTVTLVNDRVGQLFQLKPGELKVGMELEHYIAMIGRRAGWNGERIERVIANHRAWMNGCEVMRVEHNFDDGTVLSIACQPVARGGAILTYEDVTEARNSQKTIAHMAFHDALTGLKNRRMFAETVDELVLHGSAALLMIDLDRFKAVNDRMGHPVGDELLRQVASRLEILLQPNEMAFRLGGDELAVLTNRSTKRASALAHDIIAAIAHPFEIESHSIRIGCSIGIVQALAGNDASDLQRKADLALYSAKNAGRNRVELYEEGMLEEVVLKCSLEEDLADAISNNQFELWYQPLYSLPGRKLTGFEALIRWRHPERGLIPPNEFIPLAENSGLITAIGSWVIDTACRQAALWPDDIYLSVNVSAVQLQSASLAMQIRQALDRYCVRASRIEIEITETAIVENSEQTALALVGLRAIGVRIAMDDFGTGYSSLVHLHEFEIDRVKIDRSFVAVSGEDAGAAAIVRAVVSMARELGIDTTAEGIETEAQLQNLLDLGCGTAQGYLLGRPLEIGVADALVKEWKETAGLSSAVQHQWHTG